MVTQVPVARESAARNGTVTSLVGAKVGLVSMTMHGVGLTLMSKKTGSGGESGVLARINLASVRLQVGVHEFAGDGVKEAKPKIEAMENLLVVALELLGLVVAG